MKKSIVYLLAIMLLLTACRASTKNDRLDDPLVSENVSTIDTSASSDETPSATQDTSKSETTSVTTSLVTESESEATTTLTEATTEVTTTEVTTTDEATTTTEATTTVITTTEVTTVEEVTTSETIVEVDENGYPILEPLDPELEQEIIDAYINTLPDKVKNDPDFCGAYIYIYYGTYDGYPVVAMNYHGAISSSLISQSILDYWFDFPGEFLIQAYSDGKLEDISIIADNNEDAVATMHYYHMQAMNNRNSKNDSASYPELEPLNDEAIQTLIADYTEYLPDEVTSGIDFEYSFVSRYLGTYNGYEVVVMDYSMSMHADAEGAIWVGDFEFFIPYLDIEFLVHKESSFITLQKAYMDCLLTDEDMKAIEYYSKTIK